MFKGVKTKNFNELNKLNSLGNLKSKNTISYIVDFLVLFGVISAFYFLFLYILNRVGVRISRFLMVSIVILEEFAILFHCETFSPKIKNILFGKDIVTNHSLRDFVNEVARLNLLIVMPFIVSYGIFRDANIMFYINCIIASAILPISTVILIYIFDRIKHSKSNIVNILRCIVECFVMLFVYCIILLLFRENVHIVTTFIPDSCTFYESLSRLMHLPDYILQILRIDLFQLIFVVFDIFMQGIVNIFVIAYYFCIVYTFRTLINLIEIKSYTNLENIKTKLNLFLKNNNLKVYRENFIIKSCLPRSPTTSVSPANLQ